MVSRWKSFYLKKYLSYLSSKNNKYIFNYCWSCKLQHRRLNWRPTPLVVIWPHWSIVRRWSSLVIIFLWSFRAFFHDFSLLDGPLSILRPNFIWVSFHFYPYFFCIVDCIEFQITQLLIWNILFFLAYK
jgi:hypothetical protein